MEFNLDDIIKSAKKILLLSHVNPDGDTLGSMCAMYSMIEKRFKKKADMSIVSNIPFNYRFLPNIEFSRTHSIGIKRINTYLTIIIYFIIS